METIDYVRCPKCNGEGEVRDKLFYLFTFGVGFISDLGGKKTTENCGLCKGEGFIPMHIKVEVKRKN